MPYIITTTSGEPPRWLDELDPELREYAETFESPNVTRRAVATLEEAREAARATLVGLGWHTFAEAARATEAGQEIIDLPESGGTIGPLPDGTVIEVKRVEWLRVFGDATQDQGTGCHA